MTTSSPDCENCGAAISGLLPFVPWLMLVRSEISCPRCYAVLVTSGKARLLSFIAALVVMAGEFWLLRLYVIHNGPIRGWIPVILALGVPIVSYQLVSALVCRRYANLFALPTDGS